MLKPFRDAPLPVLLLILSFLCPSELSLYAGGLRLPPHRVALIILVPIALWRMMSGKAFRIHAFDILILVYAVWTGVTFTLHHGSDGIPYGGSLALECAGGYLVARVWVRDLQVFRAVISLLVASIVVTALIALPETLLHQPFAHQFMHALTGVHHHAQTEVRMGFNRAYGTFDHPIHLGTYCSSLLALVWFSSEGHIQRMKRAAILIGATLLGLSSAPMLGIGVQLGWIMWDRASRGIGQRAMMTAATIGFLYAGAMVVANRTPIAFIATTLTLNAQTGYYRMLIWDYGVDNVLASPWIGIGLNDWMRPSWMPAETIDTYWLIITMRSGLPATCMLVVALGLLISAIWRSMRRLRDKRLKRIAAGWVFSFIAFALVAATVHLWNVQHTYFYFFVGLAGWLADPVRTSLGARVATGEGEHPHARRRPSLAEPRWPIMPYPMPVIVPAATGAPWPAGGHAHAVGPRDP